MKKSLSRLKMPSKIQPEEDKMLEVELGMGEDGEEEMGEEGMPSANSEELANLSDEELLGEVKKRGLLGELEQG